MARVNSGNKILDNINNSSHDRFGNFKTKIMDDLQNLLFKKKILIYGFGKSGQACFKFLNTKNMLGPIKVLKFS